MVPFSYCFGLKISSFFKGRKKTSPCNRVTKNSSRKEKNALQKKNTGINTADKRSTGCCCFHTKALLQVRPCVNAEVAQRTEIDRPLRVA